MGSINYDKRIQPIYKLKVSLKYYDTTLKRYAISNIADFSIAAYEISKDSINYNYNLHVLTLTNISLLMFNTFHLENVRLIIDVFENGNSISSTIFKITKVHEIDKIDELYNIQLIMISEFVYNMLNSNVYSNVSTFDTSAIKTHSTSYQLLSKIFSKMSSDGGQKVKAHLTNAGEVKKLYDLIRIPENLNDVQIFDWLLKEYPPFFLDPYFIIDDFYIADNNTADINLFLLNICDINGSYQNKKYKDINGTQLGLHYLMTSEPLMDYKKVYEELQATLMIKNANENKIYELKPLLLSNRSNQILQIQSTFGMSDFKTKLYMRKKLAEAEASIETYFYDSIGLRDISFGNIYDIIEVMNFNHLPVSFFYMFKKLNDNSFKLETTVNYIKVPGSLVSGIK